MKVTSLSKSGVESYLDCPFKYYLQYACRVSSPAGKAAALGVCFHKIMELQATCHQRNKLNTFILTDYPKITRICFNRCIKENPDFEFTEEDFQTCLKWVEVINNSIRGPGKHKKILGVEQKFRYEFDKPGMGYKYDGKEGKLAVNGVIDLVVEIDDGTIEIIDYKTGKHIKDWNTGKVKTLTDFQKDLQLRLYNLVAKEMYPQYKCRILTLVYIQARKTFSVSMDLEDEIKTVDVLRRHFHEISADNMPMRIKENALRSKERYKCRKSCYYGLNSATDDGVSICDMAYKLAKEIGYNEAAPLVQMTCSIEKVGDKRKSKSFVDEKTITGVIK